MNQSPNQPAKRTPDQEAIHWQMRADEARRVIGAPMQGLVTTEVKYMSERILDHAMLKIGEGSEQPVPHIDDEPEEES